jgi:prolyl-tRNA synthetase
MRFHRAATMRLSQSLFVTLREEPAEAEIPSHKLLLRAGYIRRIGSGLYAYLPLMWRVLTKVRQIVKEEMDATGSQESMVLAEAGEDDLLYTADGYYAANGKILRGNHPNQKISSYN